MADFSITATSRMGNLVVGSGPTTKNLECRVKIVDGGGTTYAPQSGWQLAMRSGDNWETEIGIPEPDGSPAYTLQVRVVGGGGKYDEEPVP